MQYFRFAPDCHYVKGAMRGALYIVTTGKVIHFSKTETEMINCWLANEPIDTVGAKYPKIADEFLNHLMSEGLGFLYPTPVFTHPYEPYQSFFKFDAAVKPPPVIKNVFIQLSERCNANCLFCKSKDFYVSRGCVTCLRWQVPNNHAHSRRLDNNNLEKLLKQLADLETRVLSFSGGNPLLEWDRLVSIVKKAIEYQPFIRFLVHTNGFGFNEKIAKDAKKLNIGFNFTVFSDSYEGYQKITGRGDLFKSLIEATEICKAQKIIYTISVLVSPDSRPHYNKLREFARNLGGRLVSVSEIFRKTETKKPMVSLTKGEEAGEKMFQSFNPREFFNTKGFSRCLKGILAVSENGMILPCSMWIEPIAKMPEDSIFTVFRDEKHTSFWEFHKGKVPTCSRCEFRFICDDCALTEHYRKEDPSIHNAVCTYNPEKGEWISD